MPQPDATIAASAPRRIFAVAVLAVLGALLIWLGISNPPASLALQVFLLGFGVVILVLTDRLYRATQRRIELVGDELRDSAGNVLCHIDQITRLDRGTFAFKPSNGFLLVLNERGPRHWAPGMWWRMGRRIGVGGVTPGPQTKVMAEMLATKLATRERGQD